MLEKFADFNGNGPVSIESVSLCESALGITLPEDYVACLTLCNGGEGFVGNSYLILWSVDEILPFNRDYEVSSFCPELLLFGSNGGGEAYAFDRRNVPWRVVQVPFIGMDYADCDDMGSSFTEFVERIAGETATE